MDFSIKQGCPQCGAPVDLHESASLFVCPFCKVKNYITNTAGARYLLPCHPSINQEKEDLYHVPYLRFKGAIFQVSATNISHRIVDTTECGVTSPFLPFSLGYRPQAMQLHRASPQTSGRFLYLTIKIKHILSRAVHLAEMTAHTDSSILHRAYIGETLSFVYLPILEKGSRMFDAVTYTPLSQAPPDIFLREKSRPFQYKWQPDFIAALCPQCGWDLPGESDSLAMVCPNCDTAWELIGKGLRELKWQQGESSDNQAILLPFWKMTMQIPELSTSTFADFIMATRPGNEGPISFIIPAFKVRPRIFLQIAKRMTLAQHLFHFVPGNNHIKQRHPANLARTEARQAFKVILAESALNKRKILPMLPSIRFTNVNATLIYLPFHDDGHDFIQEQSGMAVNKNVLSWGRKL